MLENNLPSPHAILLKLLTIDSQNTFSTQHCFYQETYFTARDAALGPHSWSSLDLHIPHHPKVTSLVEQYTGQ